MRGRRAAPLRGRAARRARRQGGRGDGAARPPHDRDADPAHALADRLRRPRHHRAARAAGRPAAGRRPGWSRRTSGPTPTSSCARGCARAARPSSSARWSASPRNSRARRPRPRPSGCGRASCATSGVGVLHGQMPSAEKAEAMRAFAAGETDVLVATTVIEVGIDVANATVMVIEGAERFGVSQLHQLRGRVGRGEHASQLPAVRRRGGGAGAAAAAGGGRARATASSWPRSTWRCAARARSSAPARAACRASPSPSCPRTLRAAARSPRRGAGAAAPPRLARRRRPWARCSRPPAAASAPAPPTRSRSSCRRRSPWYVACGDSATGDESDRRRAEGAAAGRAARLEGAADLRPGPRGDLLGARRARRRRRRARPLLRHRRAGDRGALARRRARRCSSTATPGRRSATSSGSGSARAPSCVRADVGRWLGTVAEAPEDQAGLRPGLRRCPL